MIAEQGSPLAERIAAFVREDFTPHYDRLRGGLNTRPLWAALSALRTELWLDSGDAEAVSDIWCDDFVALTTNNTLLNKEIQKGTYDDFIVRADKLLSTAPELSAQDRKLEMAFMLNARHALKLVERFDAYVSVEEHTDLAGDADSAVHAARRFHALCPERFIVKIPFTAAGLLAVRRAAAEGIPVNFTLGFSARQNYIATRIGRPAFVNVFLGRLNSFAAENGLGDGRYVGERAALASQATVRDQRVRNGLPTRQIAASLRDGGQVRDLAGIDVLTIPVNVAREFLNLGLQAGDLANRMQADYMPETGDAGRELGIQTLWDVSDAIRQCVADLEKEDLNAFAPGDLAAFFAWRGCADVFVDWTPEQIAISSHEGKLPTLANWYAPLKERRIGLDSLLSLAGLNSFAADQAAMDSHATAVIGR